VETTSVTKESRERVLCVRRGLIPLAWLGGKRALKGEEEGCFLILQKAEPQFIPREIAEKDDRYKQIIPYVVVVARKEGNIACYRRSGTEDRLHGYISCGVGGHIRAEDEEGAKIDLSQTVYRGLKRELAEEFSFSPLGSRPPLTFQGIINDDDTPVGRVHLGLLFLWMIACPGMLLPGPELADLLWLSPPALERENLEEWSHLAMKLLYKGKDA